jgi:hypothetical protein
MNGTDEYTSHPRSALGGHSVQVFEIVEILEASARLLVGFKVLKADQVDGDPSMTSSTRSA